jgi:hypothetical protein
MAQRTTTTLVQALLETNGEDYRSGVSLQPFVDSATVLVDRVATKATAKGYTLLATELELIERWLSAHAYAMVDQTLASKSTNGRSGRFQGQTGMRLEATKYGQMALMLDTSGALEAINKRQVAGITWLGVTENEALDYEDRQ